MVSSEVGAETPVRRGEAHHRTPCPPCADWAIGARDFEAMQASFLQEMSAQGPESWDMMFDPQVSSVLDWVVGDGAWLVCCSGAGAGPEGLLPQHHTQGGSCCAARACSTPAVPRRGSWGGCRRGGECNFRTTASRRQ